MLDCGLDLFVSFVFYENELLLADNDKVDAKADYRTQISCVWLNKEQKRNVCFTAVNGYF